MRERGGARAAGAGEELLKDLVAFVLDHADMGGGRFRDCSPLVRFWTKEADFSTSSEEGNLPKSRDLRQNNYPHKKQFDTVI